MYYVTVPAINTKTKQANEFAITGAFLDFVRRYEELRPSNVTTDQFFLNYQNGRCTLQTIGKNKFYKMPLGSLVFLIYLMPNYTQVISNSHFAITKYSFNII